MTHPVSLETMYEDGEEDNLQREGHKETDLNLWQTQKQTDTDRQRDAETKRYKHTERMSICPVYPFVCVAYLKDGFWMLLTVCRSRASIWTHMLEVTKLLWEETRPDTRLPKSRAGGQGPYLRSLGHLGRSSEVQK